MPDNSIKKMSVKVEAFLQGRGLDSYLSYIVGKTVFNYAKNEDGSYSLIGEHGVAVAKVDGCTTFKEAIEMISKLSKNSFSI